jgi:hypothetical protein
MDDPRFLRLPDEPQPEKPDGETIDLGDLNLVKQKPDAVVIDLPDGAVTINFGGLGLAPEEGSSDHDANLAKYIGNGVLSGVADELMRLIGDDVTRQEQKLQDVVKGIELLGVKLEEPRSEPNSEGISVVRHPLLLEAVLRFQANARGELLPADGPVKVTNEGDGTLQLDEQANQLENDFNHYLTVGAPEYYPDTDRMFFSLGHGGEAYKKVYYHPLKRRPVSETIDRKDIILSEGAVSLESCARITHRSRMRPSVVKQMQLAGAWRDVSLSSGSITPDLNIVDKKLDDIAGMLPKMGLNFEENDKEIYECYCELDLQGFEHKEDGEETGLALPYRVTLDKESRQILEIRRWWEEGDESYVRKEVFVEYCFVPAFPGVNLGLLHILGNATRALTAAWRIALDNGMLANFPGGIMARSTGKQQTTNIRVGPGQVAPMDVDGVPLQQAFMPLPYRDVGQGFMAIIQNVEGASKAVGGTAETAVGEGRSDAPVGTTIALIEQAQKVVSAVHKRMHQAQQKEFMLLKELFRRDPESLWRNNKNPNFEGDRQKLVAALNNSYIVPKADPNTSSQTLRIQKAIAIYTLAQQNPGAFDQTAVYSRIFSMIGIEDAQNLFNKNPPGPPPVNPADQMEAQAALTSAQAKMMDAQVKAELAKQEHGVKIADVQAKMTDAQTKRQIAETDAKMGLIDQANKLQLENMKLRQSALVHREKLTHDERQKFAQMNQQKAIKGLDLADARQKHQNDVLEARMEQQAQQDHEQQRTTSQHRKEIIAEEQRATNTRRAQREQAIQQAIINAQGGNVPQGEPEQ